MADSRPTRATTEGRAYLDLQNLARRQRNADVHVLCRRHTMTGTELHESITAVAMHRRVELQTLQSALSGFASIAQGKWAAWLRRQHLADRLPDDFAAVLDNVVRFADPILSGRATDLNWQPARQTWS